jgi:hypothetical protein
MRAVSGLSDRSLGERKVKKRTPAKRLRSAGASQGPSEGEPDRSDSPSCSLKPHGQPVVPQCAQCHDYLTALWEKEREETEAVKGPRSLAQSGTFTESSVLAEAPRSTRRPSMRAVSGLSDRSLRKGKDKNRTPLKRPRLPGAVNGQSKEEPQTQTVFLLAEVRRYKCGPSC